MDANYDAGRLDLWIPVFFVGQRLGKMAKDQARRLRR